LLIRKVIEIVIIAIAKDLSQQTTAMKWERKWEKWRRLWTGRYRRRKVSRYYVLCSFEVLSFKVLLLTIEVNLVTM
jgi:hypothetical protein